MTRCGRQRPHAQARCVKSKSDEECDMMLRAYVVLPATQAGNQLLPMLTFQTYVLIRSTAPVGTGMEYPS